MGLRVPSSHDDDLDLRGVWVPLITPFDATGAVAIDTIEQLCREYVRAPARRESSRSAPPARRSALDDAEKRAVIGACCVRVPPREHR